MGDKHKTAVQEDWEEREFIENITNNIKKIAEFLNRFDTSTRYKLAAINEKLTQLERQMEHLEAALSSVSAGGSAPAATAEEG